MGSITLAETEHFIIQWWNGCDSDGIFIYQSTDETFPFFDNNPQAFIHFDCLQGLINELNTASQPLVIKNRIPDGVMMTGNSRYKLPPMPFVPNAHRKAKKNGGVWGQAYYTPLPVILEHCNELVSAIKFACSKENVERLESTRSNDFFYVLNGQYLDNGQWRSIHTGGPLPFLAKRDDAVLGGGARPSATDAVLGGQE